MSVSLQTLNSNILGYALLSQRALRQLFGLGFILVARHVWSNEEFVIFFNIFAIAQILQVILGLGQDANFQTRLATASKSESLEQAEINLYWDVKKIISLCTFFATVLLSLFISDELGMPLLFIGIYAAIMLTVSFFETTLYMLGKFHNYIYIGLVIPLVFLCIKIVTLVNGGSVEYIFLVFILEAVCFFFLYWVACPYFASLEINLNALRSYFSSVGPNLGVEILAVTSLRIPQLFATATGAVVSAANIIFLQKLLDPILILLAQKIKQDFSLMVGGIRAADFRPLVISFSVVASVSFGVISFLGWVVKLPNDYLAMSFIDFSLMSMIVIVHPVLNFFRQSNNIRGQYGKNLLCYLIYFLSILICCCAASFFGAERIFYASIFIAGAVAIAVYSLLENRRFNS